MKYRFLFLSLFCVGLTQAQQRCGTYEKFLDNAAAFPAYGQAVEDAFETAALYAQEHAGEKSGNVYRIPVVVHILHIDAAQNLDDSLVYNQIQVLNEDFRRMNADASQTRPEFLPIAADAEIEFYLATTDPQGNPTTGITRTAGTPALGTYNLISEDMKSTAAGGLDAWPTDRYLNIWVCDIFFGLGVLGYAYPPVGNVPTWPGGSAPADSSVQGVVIQFSVFGKNNPNATGPLAVVNRGRTATHEVGHFLGLRHVWGDGDCTQDDGISDTPDADDNAGQVCDWNKNTCTENPGPELPDNIENFMDYAADSCMNMFTQGQIAHMRSVLEVFRPDLYDETFTGLENPVSGLVQVYPNPAVDFIQISLLAESVKISPQVTFTNTLGQKWILTVAQGRVDVSGLNSGVYAVEVQTNSGIVVKKVLVN